MSFSADTPQRALTASRTPAPKGPSPRHAPGSALATPSARTESSCVHRPRLRDRIVLPALCALLGWVTGSPAADPRAVAWRAADGLPQTATIGVWLDPRGNVVTTHAEHLPA